MNLFDLIILAIALGVDCLIVSFTQGLLVFSKRRKTSGVLAATMGVFQGFMPVIGYFATTLVFAYVAPFAKWLVFTIFMVLGVRCLFEFFANDANNSVCGLGLRQILLLGFVTSIDAMGAGVSLRLTDTSLMFSCFVIGFMSLLMSLVGFWSGCCLKKSVTKYLQVFAGIILIFLAIKNLI